MNDQRATLVLEYDNYIFDLYGTLVDIRTDEKATSVWEQFKDECAKYGAIYKARELKAAYERSIKNEELRQKMSASEAKCLSEESPEIKYSHEASPEIDIIPVFREIFLKKGIELCDEVLVEIGTIFRRITTKYIRVYPGTIEMLEALKKAGKKVYLLSNAQRIFTMPELDMLGLTRLFDAIYISSDYRVKKPDRRFFEILISEKNIDVKRSLFIGNDSTTDIKGAKSVMLDTFYVKSNISPKGDSCEDSTYCFLKFKGWNNTFE